MPTQLEIVSPDRLLLSQPVDMAVIPASEGDMGVLQGHTPDDRAAARRHDHPARGRPVRPPSSSSAAASPRSRPERCTVLADEATPVAEVSRAVGEQRLQAAQAEYDAADKLDIPAVDAAMARMQSARAMIAAAGAA